MKANELMIGDWVHVEAHRGFNAQNVKVESIPDPDDDNKYGHHYGHICTWLCGGDNDFRDVEAKHLLPIPLTPEILEKNGFEVQDQGGGRKDLWTGFGIDCEGDIEVEFKDNIPIHLKIDGAFNGEYYTSLNITYIHQLQHALRLCGIDKEIKL